MNNPKDSDGYDIPTWNGFIGVFVCDQTMYAAEVYNGEIYRNNYAYVIDTDRVDNACAYPQFDSVEEAEQYIMNEYVSECGEIAVDEYY